MVLRIQLDEAHSCHYNNQYMVESALFTAFSLFCDSHSFTYLLNPHFCSPHFRAPNSAYSLEH